MFGRKSTLVEEKKPPVVRAEIPCPSPRDIDELLSREEAKEYISVAKSLGLQSSGVLRMVLKNLGLDEYKIDDVGAYLDSKYGLSRQTEAGSDWLTNTWGWRALRECDNYDQNRVKMGADTDYPNLLVPNRMILLRGPYKKPVPLGVLLMVDQVRKETLHLDTRFFISDETDFSDVPRDPFLAVAVPANPHDLVVIERWDEPGFKK